MKFSSTLSPPGHTRSSRRPPTKVFYHLCLLVPRCVDSLRFRVGAEPYDHHGRWAPIKYFSTTPFFFSSRPDSRTHPTQTEPACPAPVDSCILHNLPIYTPCLATDSLQYHTTIESLPATVPPVICFPVFFVFPPSNALGHFRYNRLLLMSALFFSPPLDSRINDTSPSTCGGHLFSRTRHRQCPFF